MTSQCRQIYLERIANPATPEKLRKFYARLLKEPDTVVPERGVEPPAFIHFLNHITEELVIATH